MAMIFALLVLMIIVMFGVSYVARYVKRWTGKTHRDLNSWSKVNKDYFDKHYST